MGPKINCISNCVAPCGRGKEATKVGYCIADRLFDAWSGKKKQDFSLQVQMDIV